MSDPSPEKRIIGWREWITLPDLGGDPLKAKIDTGARTSAVHAPGYEVAPGNDGKDWVRFRIHPSPQAHLDGDPGHECHLPVAAMRQVKDSGGHTSVRPFVKAHAMIGGFTWEIELSLTDRTGMKFTMLLGRTALSGNFHVNPAASYLLSTSPEKLS